MTVFMQFRWRFSIAVCTLRVPDVYTYFTCQVNAAVGPALRKAVLRGGLFTSRGKAVGEGRIARLALPLVRHLFYKIITLCTDGDHVGKLLFILLKKRNEMHVTRSVIFDLQDVQCKICTWVMLRGSGQWFNQWRDTMVIVCGVVFGQISLAWGKRKKNMKMSKALAATLGVSFAGGRVKKLKASSVGLAHLTTLLPVVSLGGSKGVRCVDIARLFTKWPRDSVTRTKLSTDDTIIVSSGKFNKTRLALNPVGVADLILHMPKSAELKKLRRYCAEVIGGKLAVPMRRQGCAHIAKFILDMCNTASVCIITPSGGVS